jgi:hypothetical protein
MNSMIEAHTPLVDFHLIQYDALRKEIESCVHEIRTLERYTLIGTGFVWAWLASNQQLNVPSIFWWIPLLFSLLGWLRTLALATSVRRLAEYIRTVEESYLCNENVIGWETYKWSRVRPSIKLSVYTFWILLSAISIVVPLIIAFRH